MVNQLLHAKSFDLCVPLCFVANLQILSNLIQVNLLTNIVFAMMVEVEMDRRQAAKRHVVVIKHVVAISNKNNSGTKRWARAELYPER